MDECDSLLFSDGSLLMMSLSVRSFSPSGHDEARTLLCAYVHWRQHVELHPLSLLKRKKGLCSLEAGWIASRLLHEREGQREG